MTNPEDHYAMFPPDQNGPKFRLVERLGLLPIAKQQPNGLVSMVILHDTAGPTLKSAEDTLIQRGLGYHYMIDRDGVCYEYATPSTRMNHALGWNAGTVGISFVGGGGFGAVNEAQIEAVIFLINITIAVKTKHSVKVLTCHKYVTTEGKVDPEFPGDPPNGSIRSIDEAFLNRIASATNLRVRD